jgi:hypothetical protein
MLLQAVRFYKCIIYPTGGTHAIHLKVRCTNPEGEPLWAEDLDLHRWLPYGNIGIRIGHIYGTKILLRNSFMVFFTHVRRSSVPNGSIACRFNRTWKGNVVVVKLGRINPLVLEHWTSDERGMVDFALDQ